MKVAFTNRAVLVFSLAALVLLGSFASSLYAQAATQRIQGLVTDATGAVIPGATVSYMNLATGVSDSVQTNETGNYTFATVAVGNYEVTCQLEGFKTDSVADQRVETGGQVRIDFSMEVGDVTETIEVSAANITLNTENAVVGGVIENKRIIELPLNGRNVVSVGRAGSGRTVRQPHRPVRWSGRLPDSGTGLFGVR